MNIQKILSNLFSAIAIIIILLIIISAFPIAGNYKILVVQSGSMEPTIHTGSVVVVWPEKEYREGDVITFKSTGGKFDSITHRLMKIEADGNEKIFKTKGDANDSPDQESVSPANVIGKVLFSVPYFGYAVAAAKTKYGFLAIIVIPAFLIIYDESKKIIDELENNKKKKEDDEFIKDGIKGGNN